MWIFSLQESSPELLNFEMSLIAHCLKSSVINAVLHAVSSRSLFVIHTYQLDTVSPARRLRLLFTSKNAIKPCSVIKITNAPLCTHGFYLYTPNCVDY